MTSLSQNADTGQLPNDNFYSIRAQILTRITRMILVLGKSALSVPDTRFSRVSGSTLVFILYKLYVLLPYTYPTPKLSPHRRLCISIFPQKNSLCMIYKRFKLWGH